MPNEMLRNETSWLYFSKSIGGGLRRPKTIIGFIEEYSSGVTDYVQLIANWRSLLRYRVALANLRSQRLQLLASLSRQIGRWEPVAEWTNSLGAPQPSFENSEAPEAGNVKPDTIEPGSKLDESAASQTK